MEIRLVNNQVSWDSWLTVRAGSFLQSWEWGNILVADGRSVERLEIVNVGEVVAQAQVMYTELPFGMKYAFCPKGPVIGNWPSSRAQAEGKLEIGNYEVVRLLLNYFKSKNCVFWRIEPQFLISNFQFQKTVDINPRATTILDLSKTDEEILTAMHEKTRYNIRLAQKKELTMRTDKDLTSFLVLSEKTAKRDGFRLHLKGHYEAVLSSSLTRQITVYKNDSAVASALFVGFGVTFTYLFGASDHEFRTLMGPHLMQWEGIKLGKQLGYKKYDFFGVAPAREVRIKNEELRMGDYAYDPHHQYAGVTRFKLGFGGSVVEDPGTYDLIISSGKYKIYKILRTLRRLA